VRPLVSGTAEEKGDKETIKSQNICFRVVNYLFLFFLLAKPAVLLSLCLFLLYFRIIIIIKVVKTITYCQFAGETMRETMGDNWRQWPRNGPKYAKRIMS